MMKVLRSSNHTENISISHVSIENPLVESKEERDFASDIEKDLNEVSFF